MFGNENETDFDFASLNLEEVVADDYSNIPDGDYAVIIESAEAKPHADGHGKRLSFKVRITVGDYRGRTLYDGLSVVHRNEMAQSIAKRKLKALHKGFSDKLEAAQAGVDAAQAEALVLDILKADLRRELDRRVVAHRQAVVAAVEVWWSKYRVTLRDIEGERDAAKARLYGFLGELGYVA